MNNFNLPFNLKNTKENETPLKVELGENKILKSFPAKTVSANEIVIIRIIDEYAQKKVVAHTRSILGQITLWEGDAYDAIGQWTDQDVKDRILEIINN